MNLFKRATAVLAGLAIIFSMSACNTHQSVPPTGTKTSNGTLFDASTELSIVISSNSSWPYDENWAIWKYIRESLGGKINLTVIPGTEIDTKVALMMSTPKNLPDLIYTGGKSEVDGYAAQGALIAIDDYLDKMPNYTKFWNTIPEEQRKKLFMERKTADGKTYYPQIYGMDRRTNLRAWLYRKDIFEKDGLKTPETMDELYDVALKLNKLYPNSYPICMRQGLRNINVIGTEWKPNFSYKVYYDFANNKWCYGAAEDTMLEIVKYFQKLNNAKLINPDYLTINSKSWEELVSTNRGFMMPEYLTRVSFFTTAKANNPDFELDIMQPPRANNATGQNMIAKNNVDPSGYMICNTGNKDRINNAIKFIDWLYSDDGSQLISWGKEGETYNVEKGEKHYIKDGSGTSPMITNGFQTAGTYLRVDPKAAKDIEYRGKSDMVDFALNHTEEQYNPANWVALDDEEKRIKEDIGTSIDTYVEEMLSKFLLGQEPMSNWDAFQKQIRDMGIDKLLEVYTEAYNRVSK